MHGIYPQRLEETFEINGETVVLRPAKPVDERRIQEHFYNLDKDDVVARFFHNKTSFVRDEVEGVSQVDYIKNLTVLGSTMGPASRWFYGLAIDAVIAWPSMTALAAWALGRWPA